MLKFLVVSEKLAKNFRSYFFTRPVGAGSVQIIIISFISGSLAHI